MFILHTCIYIYTKINIIIIQMLFDDKYLLYLYVIRYNLND